MKFSNSSLSLIASSAMILLLSSSSTSVMASSATRSNLRGLVEEENSSSNDSPSPFPTVKYRNIFEDLDIKCDTDDCVTLHGVGFYLNNGGCEEICVAKEDVKEVKHFVNVLQSYYKYPLEDGTCASAGKSKLLLPVDTVNNKGEEVLNKQVTGDGYCIIKSYVYPNSTRVSSCDNC